MLETFFKLIRFGIVGLIGTAVDFGVTFIVKEKLGINKYVANTFGFILAVVNNYFLNKYWTFNNVYGNSFIQFLIFCTISIVGLLINLGVIYVFNTSKKYPFYVTKVIGVAIVALWNFSMNFFLTFHT
ncbi:GtrA family protein [Pedobacter sp. KBS0701]|uniref:GtrA family protein n=1 Tax=Pedobacter sp. KBS0701 TaxID=2578106 RepID=UPI00110F4D2F|nr:GtrA family protein [Pedobacter sp. KBS0701]QDW24350.1 GtrA family protein [Pedobacter sp. KBS0701]